MYRPAGEWPSSLPRAVLAATAGVLATLLATGCGSRAVASASNAPGAMAEPAASATELPVLHAWLLRPTDAGRQLGVQPLTTHIEGALAAAPEGPAATRLVSLTALDDGRYRAVLACISESACQAAAARVGALSAWIADWSHDAPVHRPRRPARESAS